MKKKNFLVYAAPFSAIALVGLVSLFSVATGVMLASISADYGVSTALVGLIPSLSSGGEFLAYVLGGFWKRRRLGIKELAFFFLCLFLVVLGIGLKPPFAVLCLLYLLMGLLVGLLNFSANTVVASSFMENRSRYISIMYISMGLGCAMASLYPSMALDHGIYWGLIYRQYAGFVALLGMLTMTVLLPRIRQMGEITCGNSVARGGESALKFLFHTGRWRLGLLCLMAMMYQGHQIALVSWLPAYMTEWLHMETVNAGVTLTLFSVGLLVSRLIAALLSKQFTTRQMIVGGGLMGAGTLGIGLLTGSAWALMIACPIAGVVTGWILPMVMSCGHECFPENPVAVASTINTASALGGMLFSWLTGAIASLSFPAAISLTVVNLLIVAALMLMIKFKETGEKQ